MEYRLGAKDPQVAFLARKHLIYDEETLVVESRLH
jgi:hypothetical protein